MRTSNCLYPLLLVQECFFESIQFLLNHTNLFCNHRVDGLVTNDTVITLPRAMGDSLVTSDQSFYYRTIIKSYILIVP